MENKIQEKLQANGLNYKSGDFKPEIHFFGQIIKTTDYDTDDGIFCEVFFEAGTDWECLSNSNNIQTQTAYIDVDHNIVFAHPFDLHYTSTSIHGWPKLIARLWTLDDTNKIDLLSYGTISLPNTAGFHSLSFQSWILQGNLSQETLGYFLSKL